jgi:hypothetical protein
MLSAQRDRFEAGRWPLRWLADTPAPLVRRSLRRHLGDVHSGLLDEVVRTARRGTGQVHVSETVTVVVDAPWVLIVERGELVE